MSHLASRQHPTATASPSSKQTAVHWKGVMFKSPLPPGPAAPRQPPRLVHQYSRRVESGPHRTRQRCSGPVCDRPSASRDRPGLFRPVKTASSGSQTGPEQR